VLILECSIFKYSVLQWKHTSGYQNYLLNLESVEKKKKKQPASIKFKFTLSLINFQIKRPWTTYPSQSEQHIIPDRSCVAAVIMNELLSQSRPQSPATYSG